MKDNDTLSSLKARVKTNWRHTARTTTTFKWKISRTHLLHQAHSDHPQGTKLEVETEQSQASDPLQALSAEQLLSLSPKVHLTRTLGVGPTPMISPTSTQTTLLLNTPTPPILPAHRTAISTLKRFSRIISKLPHQPRHQGTFTTILVMDLRSPIRHLNKILRRQPRPARPPRHPTSRKRR
jgi:hypothetical protein